MGAATERSLQAVYDGDVGDQRTTVLLLGIAIATVGAAVYVMAWRWLFVASITAGIALLLVARGAVHDVEVIANGDSEIMTDVGWPLYWIEATALATTIASACGTWRKRSRVDDALL